MFYESDAHGLDGLEAVRSALEQNGLKLAASGSMNRTSTDVSSAVYLIDRAARTR